MIKSPLGRSPARTSRLALSPAHVSRLRPVLAALALAATTLALTAAPAAAEETHPFISSFGAATLRNPFGVAVDNDPTSASTGDVYVTNGSPPQVNKFDAEGNELGQIDDTNLAACAGAVDFTGPFGVAVDPSDGDVYVSDPGAGTVSAFSPTGTCLFQANVGGPYGVAIDPSHGANGTLYVSATSNGDLESLDAATGAPISSFGSGHGTALGLAADPSGDIFAVYERERVLEFEPDGTCANSCTPIDTSSPEGVAVNPANGHIFVAENEGEPNSQIAEYAPGQSSPLGTFGQGKLSGNYIFDLAVNATSGHVYTTSYFGNEVDIFGPQEDVPSAATGAASNITRFTATLAGEVDPATGGEVTKCEFEYVTEAAFNSSEYSDLSSGGAVPCSPATPYSALEEVEADLTGLEASTTYHYRLTTTNASSLKIEGSDRTFETLPAVENLSTEAATNVTAASATLNGSFTGSGEETTYYFEWGENAGYGNTTPLQHSTPALGEHVTPSAEITGLNPISEYHFRLVATINGVGTTHGNDEALTTLPSAPLLTESVSDVHSESALLHAQINPGGGDTTYHFEYGTDNCSINPDPCTSTPNVDIGSGTTYQGVSTQLSGLTQGTTYHWRVVATNVTDTTNGADRTFATFPFISLEHDHCPNAHVRQQTGAALLPDCRAYELVSAANSGGYDVESDLVEGQTPYGGYPEAENPSRVLYAVHAGAVPGTGEPTNRGPDPYIATRGKAGWSTAYVGVPADNPFSAAPFTSIPSGADSSLETFAFGGPEGCSPCFEAGYTGIPVHKPNGELVQGMVPSPSVTAPGPSAKPDGYVAKDLSADGSHFIFGSASKFAEGGNSGGVVSIYDRDLTTEETHVVSNNPAGTALPCLQNAGEGECHAPNDSNGIAELDISRDGSHILLGQKVATDADGNVYYHLYMDIGDSNQTIDLTPGATDGVLYDGMTADGSKVFFTTADALAGGNDTDTSADVYEAEVSEVGATISRVSSGETLTGNTNLCEPVSNANGPHWNTVGSAKNCDAVAIGGGGGVAATDGSIYFLSPEQLEAGEGAENQPNLYLADPGSAPRFIATLSPQDPLVLDAVKAAGTRHTADFQVSPSGEFAAFTTTMSLKAAYENAGHSEIYRYDDAGSGSLACASCDPTNAPAEGGATLAPNGLSLTNDGRVFFNSTEALVLRDTDNRKDVYEWEAQGSAEAEGNYGCPEASGCIDLVSTGSSPFDATLLGASANGADAYFFTRDKLVEQDENGNTVKIYDARELGGFEYTPPPVPCKASDECHGPSSPTPPPPNIHLNIGASGNEAPSGCKKGFVEKHGACVKKPQHHKPKHHKRANHHRGGKK